MMRRTHCVRTLLILGLILLAGLAGPVEGTHQPPVSTVDRLLHPHVHPFGIGHRGSGSNLGEDPSRPIENTVASVRKAFRAGLGVVEVDAQLTRDGHVAVFHDDFLPDFTCLNSLTLEELQARAPHVPTLREVLDVAKRFRQRSWHLSGLVIVELKAPAPLCDPDDSQEEAIAAAVVATIRDAEMVEQVVLTSFSPALLFLARELAPEIIRSLGLNALQLLTPEEVEEQLGVPVVLIDKALSLGLQWGEIGSLFRLPGYRSIDEFLQAAATVEARIVEADIVVLRLAGRPLVRLLHTLGLVVLAFTATSEQEWCFLASLTVDGIYTDDVHLVVPRWPILRAWPAAAAALGGAPAHCLGR
jgi:glycerophosphoryl diester phosphodiesterase